LEEKQMGRLLDEDIVIDALIGISGSKSIEELTEECEVYQSDNRCYSGGVYGAIRAIKELPTIQPVATDTNVGDTISRQAALDAADKIIDRDKSGSNAVVNAMIAWSEYIRTLPPAQPEPQWIPVSERLPETGGESFFDGMVLTTLRDKETGDLYVLNDKYCGDGDWLMCVPDEPTEVIAWMPLPEAYNPNK
jgi:hypothetical protein